MVQSLPTKKDMDNIHDREIFRYLDGTMVKNIVEKRYLISSFGRVIDTFTSKIYPTENVNADNYLFVNLKLNDGTINHISIHILVCAAFIPFVPANTKYEVNHKDGIKYHDWVWNLEYVTHQENLLHAVKNGLYPICENQQNALLTNNEVHEICKMIAQGLSQQQIYDLLHDQIPNLTTSIIRDIKEEKNYIAISKQYDFSNKYRKCDYKMEKFENCEIEFICSLFEKFGSEISLEFILNSLGKDKQNISQAEYTHYYNTVRRLRKKLIFKDICGKYNY